MNNLSNQELSKFRGGRYRWQIFLEKLEKEEPFTLLDESQVQLRRNQNLESIIRQCLETEDFNKLSGSLKLETQSGKYIKLSDLAKTEEFGRSKGMGGGSDQTALAESYTAYLCAKKTGGTYLAQLPFDEKETRAYFQDTDWKFEDSVDSIISSSLAAGYETFHYQSDLIKEIGKQYRVARVGTNFARKDINKWNPADIWLSTNTIQHVSGSSLQDLSFECSSENLIGLSLKKNGTNLKRIDETSLATFEVDLEKRINVIGNNLDSNIRRLAFQFYFVGNDSRKEIAIRPDGTHFKAELKTLGGSHRNGSCTEGTLNSVCQELKLNFRFSLNSHIRENLVLGTKEAERVAILKQLQEFYLALNTLELQALFISKIARECASMSKGFCPFLKLS